MVKFIKNDQIIVNITLFAFYPGWGDSGEHASRGVARREPLWRWPRASPSCHPHAFKFTLLEIGLHYSQCALLCLVVPSMDQRHRSAFTLSVWILNESHQLLGFFELYQGIRMAHSLLVDFFRAQPPAQPLPGLLLPSHALLSLSLVLSHFRSPGVSKMPRLRGKFKRGTTWQPSRPRLVLCPLLAPSHFSSSSSATSSSSLVHSTQTPSNLPPLSSSFANRLEELDC
jgi:hypothetical protein